MADVFDRERYKQLLTEHCPAPIESEEEHERFLTLAETFMEKGEAMVPEERKFLALLVILIETYENQLDEEDEGDNEPAEPPAPFETLNRLMTARGLEIGDVAHLFGNIHIATEVLSGKRPITQRHAKDLGKFFRVPSKLFE